MKFNFFKKSLLEKNSQNKKIYDIKIVPHKSTIIFRKKDWKIEFSKKDLERFFYSSRGKLISLFAVLVLIFALFGHFFFGRAEVSEFYPSSCLGGWQNPQNAALKPDLNFDASSEEFNENNSAILKNMISQIYCGNFSGTIPDNSNPKKAIIKFSWLVLENNQNINQFESKSGEQNNNLEIETSTLIQTINLNENQSSTESSTTTSTQNSIESSSQGSIISTQEGSNQSNGSSSSQNNGNSNSSQNELNTAPPLAPANQQNLEPDPRSFFDKLFKKAFAEEVVNNKQSTTDSTTISNIIESSTESLNSSSAENLNLENNSSSSNISSSSNPTNESNFLEIFYTFDGSNWQSLGKVNFSNWKNLELEIPDFNWDKLPNLQIKIQSISPTEFTPTIYLDGMVLEVEYENNDLFINNQSDENNLPDENQNQVFDEQNQNPENQDQKEIVKKELILNFNLPKNSFYEDETPLFVLTKNGNENIWSQIKNLFKKENLNNHISLTDDFGNNYQVDFNIQEQNENYLISLNKPSNWKSGNYILKLELSDDLNIYKFKTNFEWRKRPEKFFVFNILNTIKSLKYLEWQPEFKKIKKNKENFIGVISVSQDNKNLIFKGSCSLKYFVILGYRNADDYIKNPSNFIYNKAFECKNSKFYYELNDLPRNLPEGIYYFLVAEQNENSLWYPISAIQKIEIKIKEE
jgi:hypothetical protein